MTRRLRRLSPHRTPGQQSVLMLHRTRQMFVRQRTALGNAIRAHLAEFGIVAGVGRNGLDRLLTIIEAGGDERVPAAARDCLLALSIFRSNDLQERGYALKDGAGVNTGNPVDIFGANGLALTPGVVTDTIRAPFVDIAISFSGAVDFFSMMVLDAEEAFSFKAYLGNSLVQTVSPNAGNFVGTRNSSPFQGDVYNLRICILRLFRHVSLV